MPGALQKHSPYSNSIASGLITSSKLPKLQMEIEPGPFMPQPEVLLADVCREAQTTPTKKKVSRSLVWHMHSCLIPTGGSAQTPMLPCMTRVSYQRGGPASKSLISTGNSWRANRESLT